MTQEELIIAVDEYFNRHLDKKFWNEQPKETRAGAVSMAFNDVAGQIPGLTQMQSWCMPLLNRQFF